MSPIDIKGRRRDVLEILCLGAHCDDIDIGCGATLLRLAKERSIAVTWAIMSSTSVRAAESRAAAAMFLRQARKRRVEIAAFRDGFLPAQWSEVKEYFERLKQISDPDLIFTHDRADRHQDHRLVAELTWNTFRDQIIFEYEIPKYDGELSYPNVFVQIPRVTMERKLRYVLTNYRSQARSKRWFSGDTLSGLMRLRGVECGGGGFAEAFVCRKLVI